MNEFLFKLKKPKYLLWFIARCWLGLLCGVMGFLSIEESGFLNFILWIILGTQFWLDGDMLKMITPIKRVYIVIVIFIAIIVTT